MAVKVKGSTSTTIDKEKTKELIQKRDEAGYEVSQYGELRNM